MPSICLPLGCSHEPRPYKGMTWGKGRRGRRVSAGIFNRRSDLGCRCGIDFGIEGRSWGRGRTRFSETAALHTGHCCASGKTCNHLFERDAGELFVRTGVNPRARGGLRKRCKMRVCGAGPAWAKISRRCGAGYALVYAGPAVEVTALRHDGFLSQLQTNVALEVRVRGVDVALLSPLLGDIDLWSGRLRALREPGAPGNRRPAGLAARVRPRRHPRACRCRHEELLVSPRVTHRTRARAQTHLISASPSARLSSTISRSQGRFFRSLAQIRSRLEDSHAAPTWGPEGFGSVVAR